MNCVLCNEEILDVQTTMNLPQGRAHTLCACEAIRQQPPALTFEQLQAEMKRLFPDRQPTVSVVGILVPLGKLVRAHIKSTQEDRQMPAKYEAAAKDAVGEAVILLADYCIAQDFDLQTIMQDTWARVRQRAWRTNAKTGKAAS